MPSLSTLTRSAFFVFLAGLAGQISPCAELRAESLLTFPEKPVDRQLSLFSKSIQSIHEKSARSRSPLKEEELRKRVSKKYLALDARYSKIKDPKTRARALTELALLYAELAWVERIAPLRESIEELDEDLAARLGYFEESDNFLVRVVGAEAKWGTAALKLAEAARASYLELFGFSAISKLPGKKIRILIHIDADLKKRLFFHPSPPYHCELRFEAPAERFLTRAGKLRIVYGFCHELGHMIAMWGKYRVVEDDKHAWAHYTGSLIVDAVYDKLGDEPWPTWTAFQKRASGTARLLKQIEGKTPGTKDYDSILKLFHTIGEDCGTDVYGRAWKWLEKKRRFRRLNRVPYLWLKDLGEALIGVSKKSDAKEVRKLFLN